MYLYKRNLKVCLSLGDGIHNNMRTKTKPTESNHYINNALLFLWNLIDTILDNLMKKLLADKLYKMLDELLL